jgi:hypothetical protein
MRGEIFCVGNCKQPLARNVCWLTFPSLTLRATPEMISTRVMSAIVTVCPALTTTTERTQGLPVSTMVSFEKCAGIKEVIHQ